MTAAQTGMRAVNLVFFFEADPENCLTASNRALAWCGEHGMSVGRMQRDDPRGILFGDYDIQKWRNLDAADRAALHGIFERRLDGAVRITRYKLPVDLALNLVSTP